MVIGETQKFRMKKSLKIIFFGTPDFAVASLKAIHENAYQVLAVVTAPDREAGRGRKVQQSAVKKYALENKLPILQPSNLKSPDFLKELESYKADLQIVVAFRMLPEMVWNMPPLGTFNLHASLLPQYRGAAPINWAIINGETETGVSTFFLKHEIDTGDLLFQSKLKIEPNETAGSLHDKLMELGAELVLKTVEAIQNEQYESRPQSIENLNSLKKAPKIYREDCQIKWNQTYKQIDQLVRGLSPYPAAWTCVRQLSSDKKLNIKVYQLSLYSGEEQIAEESLLQEDGRLLVGCKDATLLIEELQVEGKRKMKTKELLNGFSLDGYNLCS